MTRVSLVRSGLFASAVVLAASPITIEFRSRSPGFQVEHRTTTRLNSSEGTGSISPSQFQWQANEGLSSDQIVVNQVSIAVREKGEAAVVWSGTAVPTSLGGDDCFIRFRSVDGIWTAETKINSIIDDCVEPEVAWDRSGGVHVVWRDHRRIYHSELAPGSSNWTAATEVSGSPETAKRDPAIAVGSAGDIYVVWRDLRLRRATPFFDIFSAHRDVSGTWEPDEMVNSTRSFGRRPDIVVDSLGQPHVIWAFGTLSGGILHTLRSSSGWELDEKVSDESTWSGGHPSIAIDGQDTLYAVWNGRAAGTFQGLNIYFSKKPFAGNWTPTQLISDDGSMTADRLKTDLAVNGDGEGAAVWIDTRSAFFDVFSSFLDTQGQWTENFRVNDEPGEVFIEDPHVAMDAAGNAYAVWEDRRVRFHGTVFFSTTAPSQGSPMVDLSISDILPIQVVEGVKINSDDRIDLILGKPMVVRVTVEVLNGDADDLVDVEVSYQGDAQVETHTVLRLQTAPVDFFLTPDVAGDFSINASVDPANQIDETDETNNDASVDVTVKDTRDLKVVYMPVEHLGPLSEYTPMVQNSNEFIKGVYPIAPAELITTTTNTSLEPSPFNTLGGDLVWLWIQGKRISGDADRIVGVVPREYFEFHLDCVPAGLAIRRTLLPLPPPLPRDLLGFWIPAVFVLEGHWTAAAHEIGHTYNLEHEFEAIGEDPCTAERTGDGLRATGYWVERREPKDTLGFMGTAPGGAEGHSFDRWAEFSRFIQLLDQFRINQSDPEVLLVSGFVHPDGETELAPLYKVEDGIIDEVAPGDHIVQLLDPQGKIIQEISFGVASTLFVDPFPAIESDTGVFAFAIPFPEDVQSLRILRNDVLVVDIVVTTQLLHDAVDAIPDFGFTRNSSQRRIALHNKVDALEAQIRNGAFTGAVNKLQHDIRPTMESWLVDDYQPENVLQYSKAEILDLVDEMVQRLTALE